MTRRSILTMRRIIIAAAIIVASAIPAAAQETTTTVPQQIVTGDRAYCETLRQWAIAHPDEPEFDGWPRRCRETYPDLGPWTVETTTSTTTAAPLVEPVSVAVRYTG